MKNKFKHLIFPSNVIVFIMLISCSNNKQKKMSQKKQGYDKSNYAIKIETKEDRIKYKGDSNFSHKFKKTKLCHSGTASKVELEEILKKTGNHK